MNKTIQSNSYQGYSESLLTQWIIHFNESPDQSFLNATLLNCLKDFRDFASAFTREAIELSKDDPLFQSLDETGKKNFEMWRNEKISKALDVYWAPLSQAATQYSSPAYAIHYKTFLELSAVINGFLEKVNELACIPEGNRITLNEVLLFFDELTLIRLAPYTKTALIGVPFRVFEAAASSTEEKLAGIAHELGHFVYWRLAQFKEIELRHKQILVRVTDALKAKRPGRDEREIRFIRAWFEELFADFIGASLSGSTYVESCKAMILRSHKDGSSLGDNDQEHVADILRPLVSMYTVNRDRQTATNAWRDFFRSGFRVDMTKINIETIKEDDNQRSIQRTPEEIYELLLDTIDVLAEEISKGSDGMLYPNFVDTSNAVGLKEKATRIQSTQLEAHDHGPQDASTALDIFLEPYILESGAQTHTHSVTLANHQKNPWSFQHTH